MSKMETTKIAPSEVIIDEGVHFRGENPNEYLTDNFIESIAKSKGPRVPPEGWKDRSGKIHITDGTLRTLATLEAIERELLPPTFKMTVQIDSSIKSAKSASEKSFLIGISRRQFNRLAVANKLMNLVYKDGKKVRSIKSVADEYGIAPSKVSTAVLVAMDAPKPVRIALDMGKITLEQARRLCNLASDKVDAALQEILEKNNPSEVSEIIDRIAGRMRKRPTIKAMIAVRAQLAKGVDDLQKVKDGKTMRSLYLMAIASLDYACGNVDNADALIDPLRIPGMEECMS
jgi:hypothetical protein